MSLRKAKILIYASNQFLFRYFKKIFPEYECVFFSGNLREEITFVEFDMIIFIMETPAGFVDFFKIYNSGIPIIFGTSERKIYERKIEMEAISDIKFIDMSGTKMDIRDQVKIVVDVIMRRG